MAKFGTRTFGASANTNTNGATSTDTSWKSQAFLNFRLPLGKIGFIGLKMSDPVQKGLIEWLQADASNLDKFLSTMSITFNPADAPREAIAGFVTGNVEPMAPVEGKPAGYLNIDVKVEGDKSYRFGFLPLYDDQRAHRDLMAGLTHADEAIKAANHAWMGEELDVTFELAQKKVVKFACMAA